MKVVGPVPGKYPYAHTPNFTQNFRGTVHSRGVHLYRCFEAEGLKLGCILEISGLFLKSRDF